jgi:hypothetical protein
VVNTPLQGRWILPVRFLVRAKVFQLLGVGVVGMAAFGLTAVSDGSGRPCPAVPPVPPSVAPAPPLAQGAAGALVSPTALHARPPWLQEALSPSDVAGLSALVAGCVGGSLALNYYSGRYVGELALLHKDGQPNAARFSVLDFWGNRLVRLAPAAWPPRDPAPHSQRLQRVVLISQRLAVHAAAPSAVIAPCAHPQPCTTCCRRTTTCPCTASRRPSRACTRSASRS